MSLKSPWYEMFYKDWYDQLRDSLKSRPDLVTSMPPQEGRLYLEGMSEEDVRKVAAELLDRDYNHRVKIKQLSEEKEKVERRYNSLERLMQEHVWGLNKAQSREPTEVAVRNGVRYGIPNYQLNLQVQMDNYNRATEQAHRELRVFTTMVENRVAPEADG